MKKVISILLCFLVTICLASCTLSLDGASSMPTNTDPNSDVTFSSNGDGGGSSNATSSKKPNSQQPSKPQNSSNISSFGATSSGNQQTSRPTSSAVTATSSQGSSIGSTGLPTSSENVSSNQTSKPDIKPIKPQNYYAYSRLNSIQQQAYNSILSAADAMPSGFIELGDADKVKMSDAYLVAVALKNDHPEIFWLPYAWYIGKTHNGQMAILFANEMNSNASGSIESFTATYVIERQQKQSMQNELSAAVQNIKSKITATDPYEIELQIHDILCSKINYDHSSKPSSLSYTAYGALVKGKAVCEGYSRAYQLLLYEFGINSTLVTGYAGQEHMWNMVEIGGKWYHVDITWNDQESELRHVYFNITDPSIGRDHIINTDYKNLTEKEVVSGEPFNYALPVCNSVSDNFFEKTGYTLPRDMDRLVTKMAREGLKTAEVIGWSKQVETTFTTKLRQKGVTAGINFLYDGDWAKISIAK